MEGRGEPKPKQLLNILKIYTDFVDVVSAS